MSMECWQTLAMATGSLVVCQILTLMAPNLQGQIFDAIIGKAVTTDRHLDLAALGEMLDPIELFVTPVIEVMHHVGVSAFGQEHGLLGVGQHQDEQELGGTGSSAIPIAGVPTAAITPPPPGPVHPDVERFRRVMRWYVVVNVLSGLFSGLRSLGIELAMRSLAAITRRRVFHSLVQIDIAHFDALHTGQLTSRLTNDVSAMVSPLSTIMNDLVSNSILLVGGVFMAFLTSWKLSVLGICVVPPISFIYRRYSRWAKGINRGIWQAYGDTNAVATEAISNIRTVRAFAAEDYEIGRFEQGVSVALDYGTKNAYVGASVQAFSSYMNLLTAILILWYGGNAVIAQDGSLTIGGLVTFQLYWNLMNSAFLSLSNVFNQLIRASSAAERVFQIIDATKDKASLISTPKPPTFLDRILPSSGSSSESLTGDQDILEQKGSTSPAPSTTSTTATSSSTVNNNTSRTGDATTTTSSSTTTTTSAQQQPASPVDAPRGVDMENAANARRTASILSSPSSSAGSFLTVTGRRIDVPDPPATAKTRHIEDMPEDLDVDLEMGPAAATISTTPTDDQHRHAVKNGGGNLLQPAVLIQEGGSSSSSTSPQLLRGDPNGIADTIPRELQELIPVPRIEHGELSLEDLHFRYQTRPDNPVLNGLTLRLKPNTTTALVGKSGGGKSTVIHLLLKFYDPTAGCVKLDGQDLRLLNPQDVRRFVGFVAQDTQLFGTSILNNLLYGMPNRDTVSTAEVVHACKLANAHSFIMETEDGYQTRVGEKGVMLSGGQKQRLALARCFLRKPKFLFLDEATSALDAENEALVQEGIDRLLATCHSTVLLIAHRLSTVMNADQIAVLSGGKVHELGNHQSLVEQNGIYAKLVARQMKRDANVIKEHEVEVDGQGAEQSGAKSTSSGRGGQKNRDKAGGGRPGKTEIDELLEEEES
ncbi:unnamed protein product [Amoebophrya sp. A25]|nr:unnamed protein product [Amoebophrya sp. A25]|eukprot:GSA25T00002488001.1